MPTSSFDKEFAITKQETIDKLEKAAIHTKPLKIGSKNVIANLRRSDKILLDILRSKN